MSFEEKNTWVYAAVSLLAYGAYLAIILGRAQDVPLAEVPYAGTMLWTIGAAIAASIVGRIVIAVAWPRDADKKDERDREVYRFGEYVGQWSVVVGAAGYSPPVSGSSTVIRYCPMPTMAGRRM